MMFLKKLLMATLKFILKVIVITLLSHSWLPSSAHAALFIKTSCEKIVVIHECARTGGVEYFYIYDEIDAKTGMDMAMMSGAIPLNQPFPKVYINSHGGNVFYARQIGRILRLRSATIEQRDMISPEREARCASACVELAAGAVKRNLIQLQVHKGHIAKRIKGEIYKYYPMPETEMQEASNYFAEMGVDTQIIDLIKKTDEKHEWAFITYDPKKPLHEQLIYKLGYLSDENIAKDLHQLHKFGEQDDIFAGMALPNLASHGDAEAAYKLARRYLYGADGVDKNPKLALSWFQKAGELGNASGYHMLGVLYDQDPKVVKRDLRKSTEYYRKAAELGFSGSQNNLAWSYYKGKGVRKNVPEAIYWATRSAEQGEPFAYSTLSEIRYERNGFPQDDVETLKWTLLALNSLPPGDAKNSIYKQSKALMRRMTRGDIDRSYALVKNWRPLIEGGLTMRDKDDK
jgi:hypothetical protein